MKTDSRRWDRWAPWGLGAGVLALGLLVWEWFPPGIWHDDGVYVLLGKALSEGHGLRYSGVVGAYLAPKFPPLFPLLLAALWSVAPAFPGNLILLSSANLVIMAVTAGIFLAYVRKVLRVPPAWALAAAVLAWLSPALWRVAMVPLSEPLFILFGLLALWAGGRLEEVGGRRSMGLFLLFALAAFYTRTMGVVFILAGAVGLFLRRRWREGGQVLFLGLGLALPWVLWSGRVAESIPDPLQDTLGPYGSWLAGAILQSPGHYLSFLPANALSVVARALSLLLPGVLGSPLWVGVLLLPVLCLGLWTLGRKSLMVPISAVFYVLILLLWPFEDVRLMVPLLPLLVLGVVVGFRVLLTSDALAGTRRAPAALLASIWLLAILGFSLYRLGTGWPAEAYRIRSDALLRAVKAVQEKTPPDAVVGAPELWAGIYLYTERQVSPSARFLPLSTHGPPWGLPEEQYRLWWDVGLTHILVEHGGRVHGEALDRVDATCSAGTVQVLDIQPGQFLVRLNWDEACRTALMEPGP